MLTARLLLAAGIALVLGGCATGVDTPPAPPPQPPATITATQPGPPTSARVDCDRAVAEMDDLTKSRCGIPLEYHGPRTVGPGLGSYEHCRWSPDIGWFCRYSVEGGYFDVPDDDPGLGTCAGRTWDECFRSTTRPSPEPLSTVPAEDSTTAPPELTTETTETTETRERTTTQDTTDTAPASIGENLDASCEPGSEPGQC